MCSPLSHMNGGSHHEFISGTNHSCEKREYVFIVFREYTIISPLYVYLLSCSIYFEVKLIHTIIVHDITSFFFFFLRKRYNKGYYQVTRSITSYDVTSLYTFFLD